MSKSPDAFRTISEVADWLGIQAHVLRFWESKFTQVKPIKRAGGRRYYRPADMLLLGGIKRMLHDDGLTIKGVQKVLREEGMNYVAAMSAPLDELTQAEFAEAPTNATIDAVASPPDPESSEKIENVVLPFDAARAAETEQPEALQTAPEDHEPAEIGVEDATQEDGAQEDGAQPAENKQVDPETQPILDAATDIAPQSGDAKPAAADTRPEDTTPSRQTATPTQDAPQDAPKPKPRIIDVSIDFAEEDIPAKAGAVSSARNLRKLSPDAAADIAPLLSRLSKLRAAMGSGRSLVAKD